MVNLLSIDYGERHLGIAVNTDLGTFPLEPIDAKKSLMMDSLKKIIADYGIAEIIIGIPLGNKEGEKKVRDFAKKLEERTKIRCRLIDESMTSQVSMEKMRNLGVRSKTIKAKNHSIAAYLLLRSYLESFVSDRRE